MTDRNIRSIPWENKSVYASWVANTYAYVAHTTELLRMCADYSTGEDKARFSKNDDEESGHEKLLINDLKFIGEKLEDHEIFPATEAFWQTQFYYVSKLGPNSLTGYSLFLEALAVKSGNYIREQAGSGGLKGTTFLKVHAEEDSDHVANAFKALDQYSKSDLKYVLANLETSSWLYGQMLESVKLQQTLCLKTG